MPGNLIFIENLPLKTDLWKEEEIRIVEPQPAEAPRPVWVHRVGHGLLSRDMIAELSVQLNKDAYYPREPISCRLGVTNHSPNKKLQGIKVAVRQIEVAKAKGGSNHEVKNLWRSQFQAKEFPVGQTTAVEFKVDLPEKLAPTTTLTKLIQLTYAVEATLQIPWAKDVEVTIPFKIITKKPPLKMAE